MWTTWQAADLKQARIDLWTRVACLTIAVTLAIATSLLSGLAFAMMVLALRLTPTGPEYRFGLVAEGVVACAVVLMGTSSSDIYIIYLAAPAFLAGLRRGLLAGIAVVAGELVAAAAAQTQLTAIRPDLVALWGPWLFMAFAVSILGARIRQLQLLQDVSRTSPYESAHHLLAQLRTVTRELPGGLDIEAVSETVLSRTLEMTGQSGSAAASG
jgi:hypothetical protein